MKKKLFAAVTVAAIPLLLTGCGGKKLTCTEKNDSGEMKQVLVFKGDKVSSWKMEIVANDVSNDIKESELCNDIKKDDYVKSCSGSIKNGKATIKTTLDIEKTKKASGYSDERYKKMKESFEKDGFTCK